MKEDGVELKRQSFDARKIFIIVSWLLIAIYLWIGLLPAEATQYVIAGRLEIPSISLSSEVTELTLEGARLDTPDYIVGSYSAHENKTLLIAHSTTAFKGLKDLQAGEIVKYEGKNYQVVAMEVLEKKDISMREILAGAEKDTIIMMTCSGTLLEGGDATHRLIVTAEVVDL